MLFVLDIMQVAFVTMPNVDLPTAVSRKKNEQCYEAHAYSVPAVGT